MNQKLANLRLKYENFRKGNEDALMVRSEALAVLEEAKEEGNEPVIDEVEEMLLDLFSFIQESKCNCNRSCC
jgi:hypothetical protein